MELVYLWVEKYKNIEKQGFNFSPRFSCDYNEETKELTINENNDYIENFFGDNINVTAIVGKNGSGKSSVLKLILMSILYDIDKVNYENKLFLVFKNGDKFKKISIRTAFTCNKKISELKKDELDLFTIYFNYMLDTLYDGEEDNWIKKIYHKDDSYTLPLLLEPYKNNNNREVIDLEIIEYLNNQNLLRFYHTLSSNKKITKFFNPNTILFYNPIFRFPPDINDKYFKCLEKSGFKEIGHKFWNIVKNEQVFLDIEEFDDNFCKIIEQIGIWYEKNEYKNINLFYIVLKVKTSNKKLFNEKEYNKYDEWLLKLLDNKYDITPPDINLDNLISTTAPDYEVRKIKICIDFDKEKIYENDLFLDNIGKKISIKDIEKILKLVPPWVNVEFFEDKKSIKSLSSGEKTFFTFLINLMYQVQNLNNRNEYKTINIFLDETELGFHPQWQKEYLKNILFSLKQINKKRINIIFATHSPFLLSDIPKENIMFLNNGEQVQGIEKKQTFGANIHTLLSDSFFMEGGLMGEFAKAKIDKVIELLNQEKLDEKELKYCEQIISIIGEPIVKNQLQRMLDSKRLKKVDEIDAIKKSMEAMQKRLDELEK